MSDIDKMRHTLQRSGYEIAFPRGTGTPGSGTPRGAIRDAIRTGLDKASDNGVLLIYFTGHGMTLDGTDYLVPSDAFSAEDGPDERDLIPVIPDHEALARCRARLVVFITDACRNDPASAGQEGQLGGPWPRLRNGQQFVLISGCGADQICQYAPGGSTFTRVLAEVLDPRHHAKTLGEVWDEVLDRMRRKADPYQDIVQVPAIRYEDGLTAARNVPICLGDERADAWDKALKKTRLLSICDSELREQVHDLARNCARQYGEAEDQLRQAGLKDPWPDQNYPDRVLGRTEDLLRSHLDDLQPAEAAILAAAPFLREAVLAQGIRLAAGVKPAELDRTYDDGPRGDLELTHEQQQHLVQRARDLRQRGLDGDSEAADQICAYLVHQWLASRASLWDGPAAESVKAGANLIGDCAGLVSPDELRSLVTALLTSVGAGPDDQLLLDKLSKDYASERWRWLASVLWLAGILAVDLRRTPTVVPDLFGTEMRLAPADVQLAADKRTQWKWKGQDMCLEGTCDHPAIHDAFENVVQQANATRKTIEARFATRAGNLIDRLPRDFTADALRPAQRPSPAGEERPVYDVPLARFQIAEDKVRELLMGRQLYGDESLAIREVYQNALDACRWREKRRRARDWKDPSGNLWIRIRQGTDPAGRRYIECEDNGVGMEADALKHVFANAGERFVYGQEFRAEQTEWENHDPPIQMVPNSQFGVGVFSYFMLADEITVFTRHENRRLNQSTTFEAHIASSGSLFQVKPAPRLREVGTLVRFYLRGDTQDISVLKTLRDLLWVTPYRVEVTEGSGKEEIQEVWEPGELRYPGAIVPPLRCGEDLWWVPEEGGLAADGIKTGHEIQGLVINLQERRRPQFTVDRKTLRSWDETWVRDRIGQALPDLIKWPGFTLSWLWKVADSQPAIAQQIFDHAVRANCRIPVSSRSGLDVQVPLSVVGCLPSDDGFLRDDASSYSSRLESWRGAVWKDLWMAPLPVDTDVIAQATEGFPVPGPVDAELLGEFSGRSMRYLPGSFGSSLSGSELLNRLTHPDYSVRKQLRRARKYAITGLDLSAARAIPAVDAAISHDDASLLATLTDAVACDEQSPWYAMLCLLQASAKLGLPLRELLLRARRLTPDGWLPSFAELGAFATHICQQDEAKLLSRDLDGQEPWITGSLRPAHLALASSKLDLPFTQILETCDRLAPLGLEVEGRDSYPQREITRTEQVALRHVHSFGQPLTLLHLAEAAGQAGLSVGELHHALADLEQSGLLVRPELTVPHDYTPTPQDLRFIDQRMEDDDYEDGKKHLLDFPCLEIIAVLHQERPDPAEAEAARRLVPFAEPHRELGAPELIWLAARLKSTLAEANAAMLKVYPKARVPELEGNLGDKIVSPTVKDVLIGRFYSDRPQWQLRSGDIVTAAQSEPGGLRALLDELAPFRKLGAPLPVWDNETMEKLSQITIDGRDEAMLSTSPLPYSFDREYLQRITALDLIKIAGRLGWTLAHAHWRLSRLAPIGLTIEYPEVDLPEQIVRWQDLLLLTQHLNGAPPVITGEVTRQHLETVAMEVSDADEPDKEEIEETVAWLRSRLDLYAPLFQLTIKSEDRHAG